MECGMSESLIMAVCAELTVDGEKGPYMPQLLINA
jgi:hypothetical protein